MFSERFDALMNIAEISNSLLGRAVHINPSHIGRLRSGARPLPKKHAYLPAMCRYLAGHIRKDYQINALQKLTGIGNTDLTSTEATALFLEQWLTEQEQDTSAAAKKFISGFSQPVSGGVNLSILRETEAPAEPPKNAMYLYGNDGKRKAVEQFFALILQEERPQTLLLFSDEDMAWLYEDAAFAAKWATLFTKVLLKGNRVKIIHTVSRDLNEMLEALTKWVPIYLTGMIEPYCYPRLRDGIFRRTLFIAPNTAAVISSSVQQHTAGMLNLFLTDKSALAALTAEYEHYFALCRPLMEIFTAKDSDKIQQIAESFTESEGNAYLCSALPPLFTFPRSIIEKSAEQNGNKAILSQWEQSLDSFNQIIKKQHLTLVLSDFRHTPPISEALPPLWGKLCFPQDLQYTAEQYEQHITHLKQLEKQYHNLSICFVREFADATILYIKEDTGVIMAKLNAPQTTFIISDKNMVSAFGDYLKNCVLI